MQIVLNIPDVRMVDALAVLLALLTVILTYQFIAYPSKILSYRHTDNTWALVTGASDGIGHALTTELAAKGFNVILHGRNAKKVKDIISTLQTRFPNRSFRAWILDASDRAAHAGIEPFAASLHREKLELSVLINNVGISVVSGPNFRPFAANPAADIDKLVNVNALFPTQLTRALLPLLTAQPGALVLNLGSAAGLFPAIYTSVYGASKAFQFHLTRILRNELAAEGQGHVEVMSVLIGLVASAGTKEFIARPSLFAPSSATYARAILRSVGCGREMVNPYWPHVLQMAVPQAVPAGVLAYLVRRAGIDMKAEEEKQLLQGKEAQPNPLSEALVS